MGSVAEIRIGLVNAAARAGAALIVGLTPLAVHETALAEEYWVDPGASGPGAGSQSAPFRSLDAALEAVAAGDTLWLQDGDYGSLEIQDAHHATAVVVAAADGATPSFGRVDVRNSSGWTLRGLEVRGEGLAFLMEVRGEALVVEDCSLFSALDTRSWTAQDWLDRASGGIQVGGTDITIRHNHLLNVAHGIVVGATHSLVENNVIENFSRDGMRGLGDHTVFQYNTVKNAYDVDDHHDDGFQSWSVGDGGVGTGEVVGIVLRGNTFINYEDPNQPHRGTLQGIGCFDGTFVDWVVENNVVLTDHWHGITLLGARDCTVRNNTVIDLNTTDPGPPWISLDEHKDGTASTGCTVRNNLTTDLRNGSSVLEEGNIELEMGELAGYFVDTTARDLHLLHSALAIDMGVSIGASEVDRDRVPRPQGEGFDVGAYEWHDGSALPPEDPGAGQPVGEEPDAVPDSAAGAASDGTAGTTGAPAGEPPNGGFEPHMAGAAPPVIAGAPNDGGCSCSLHGRGKSGLGGWVCGVVLVFALGWWRSSRRRLLPRR